MQLQFIQYFQGYATVMENNNEANSDIISSIDRIFLVEVRAGVKLGNNSYFQYQQYIQQIGWSNMDKISNFSNLLLVQL